MGGPEVCRTEVAETEGTKKVIISHFRAKATITLSMANMDVRPVSLCKPERDSTPACAPAVNSHPLLLLPQ